MQPSRQTNRHSFLGRPGPTKGCRANDGGGGGDSGGGGGGGGGFVVVVVVVVTNYRGILDLSNFVHYI